MYVSYVVDKGVYSVKYPNIWSEYMGYVDCAKMKMLQIGL